MRRIWLPNCYRAFSECFFSGVKYVRELLLGQRVCHERRKGKGERQKAEGKKAKYKWRKAEGKKLRCYKRAPDASGHV